MQVTKGTWRMREQCVPGSLSSSPVQEPGNEAKVLLYTNSSGSETAQRVVEVTEILVVGFISFFVPHS